MKKLIRTMLTIAILINCIAYSQPPAPSLEQPEILNQGPIHEAFAQPVDLTPQQGIIAPITPPANILENPDAERPSGPNFIWIPGYWGWDAERNDYVWISGCWRIPPANMSWIPGYWSHVTNGWQWVAGFWIPYNQASQIVYLPQPPQIQNVQPPVASSDSIWVPDCYYWQNGMYILRPGYWLAPQENWVWVPSHYTWTPYGYVFVPGYWDTVLTSRGILYAPVYFPAHFYRPPTYAYPLSVIVDIGNLQFSLFSYPRYDHYYFGDYYGDSYIKIGIYPWFEFESHRGWYDPIFVYDRWHYRRTVPDWSDRIRHEYDFRRDHRDYRPPRTYHELRDFNPGHDRQRNDFQMVRPIGNYAGSKNTHLEFSRMNDREHAKTFSQTTQVNNFRQERMRIETHTPSRESSQQPRESITPQQHTAPSIQTRPQEQQTRTHEQTRPQGQQTRTYEQTRPQEQTGTVTRPTAPAPTGPSNTLPERSATQRYPSVPTAPAAAPSGRTPSRGPTERGMPQRPVSGEKATPQKPVSGEKSTFENRTIPERREIPQSPVTSKGSSGRGTPASPEKEKSSQHDKTESSGHGRR